MKASKSNGPAIAMVYSVKSKAQSNRETNKAIICAETLCTMTESRQRNKGFVKNANWARAQSDHYPDVKRNN